MFSSFWRKITSFCCLAFFLLMNLGLAMPQASEPPSKERLDTPNLVAPATPNKPVTPVAPTPPASGSEERPGQETTPPQDTSPSPAPDPGLSSVQEADIVDCAGVVRFTKAGSENIVVPRKGTTGGLQYVGSGSVVVKGMKVMQGDIVATQQKSWAELATSPSSNIRLGERTTVKIGSLLGSADRQDDHVRVEVASGGVYAGVSQKLEGKSSFQIKTPLTLMNIVGTNVYVFVHNDRTYYTTLTGEATVTISDGVGNERVYTVPEGYSVNYQGDGPWQDEPEPLDPEEIDAQNLLYIVETLSESLSDELLAALREDLANRPPEDFEILDASVEYENPQDDPLIEKQEYEEDELENESKGPEDANATPGGNGGGGGGGGGGGPAIMPTLTYTIVDAAASPMYVSTLTPPSSDNILLSITGMDLATEPQDLTVSYSSQDGLTLDPYAASGGRNYEPAYGGTPSQANLSVLLPQTLTPGRTYNITVTLSRPGYQSATLTRQYIAKLADPGLGTQNLGSLNETDYHPAVFLTLQMATLIPGFNATNLGCSVGGALSSYYTAGIQGSSITLTPNQTTAPALGTLSGNITAWSDQYEEITIPVTLEIVTTQSVTYTIADANASPYYFSTSSTQEDHIYLNIGNMGPEISVSAVAQGGGLSLVDQGGGIYYTVPDSAEPNKMFIRVDLSSMAPGADYSIDITFSRPGYQSATLTRQYIAKLADPGLGTQNLGSLNETDYHPAVFLTLQMDTLIPGFSATNLGCSVGGALSSYYTAWMQGTVITLTANQTTAPALGTLSGSITVWSDQYEEITIPVTLEIVTNQAVSYTFVEPAISPQYVSTLTTPSPNNILLAIAGMDHFTTPDLTVAYTSPNGVTLDSFGGDNYQPHSSDGEWVNISVLLPASLTPGQTYSIDITLSRPGYQSATLTRQFIAKQTAPTVVTQNLGSMLGAEYENEDTRDVDIATLIPGFSVTNLGCSVGGTLGDYFTAGIQGIMVTLTPNQMTAPAIGTLTGNITVWSDQYEDIVFEAELRIDPTIIPVPTWNFNILAAAASPVYVSTLTIPSPDDILIGNFYPSMDLTASPQDLIVTFSSQDGLSLDPYSSYGAYNYYPAYGGIAGQANLSVTFQQAPSPGETYSIEITLGRSGYASGSAIIRQYIGKSSAPTVGTQDLGSMLDTEYENGDTLDVDLVVLISGFSASNLSCSVDGTLGANFTVGIQGTAIILTPNQTTAPASGTLSGNITISSDQYEDIVFPVTLEITPDLPPLLYTLDAYASPMYVTTQTTPYPDNIWIDIPGMDLFATPDLTVTYTSQDGVTLDPFLGVNYEVYQYSSGDVVIVSVILPASLSLNPGAPYNITITLSRLGYQAASFTRQYIAKLPAPTPPLPLQSLGTMSATDYASGNVELSWDVTSLWLNPALTENCLIDLYLDGDLHDYFSLDSLGTQIIFTQSDPSDPYFVPLPSPLPSTLTGSIRFYGDANPYEEVYVEFELVVTP